MEKKRFEEILKELNLEKNQWYILDEVDSIILKNGRGIYPNWKYMRILFTDKCNILLQYGKTTAYGNRLSNSYSISYDGKSISFPPNGVLFQNQLNFRLPAVGDILRSSNENEVLSEAFIIKITKSINAYIIQLSSGINQGRLSFYDPKMKTEDSFHSSYIEGFYTRYKPNNGKKFKYGIYHEKINCKNISEILLKLDSKTDKKTYTIK